MFSKSQPEYEFNCKCLNEQFHFDPQDDMIMIKTEQVYDEFLIYYPIHLIMGVIVTVFGQMFAYFLSLSLGSVFNLIWRSS